MSEEAREFLASYGNFVTKVTSEPSLNQSSLDARMKEIDSSSPIESARLLTAALGLGSETGEFVEIVKKMLAEARMDKDPAFPELLLNALRFLFGLNTLSNILFSKDHS